MAFYDRHNTVVDRRDDRRNEKIEAVLAEMPKVRARHGEYRARREQGVDETPEEQIGLDASRSALQAAAVLLPEEGLKQKVEAWVRATQLYTGHDPEMPVWKEEAL